MGSTRERVGGVSGRGVERRVAKFDRLLERSGELLVDRFGEEAAAVMRGEMLDEYRRLIPEVPYIGGRRNPYSGSRFEPAWKLAVYRVVGGHGGDVEDAGELIHQMVRIQAQQVPRAIRPWVGRFMTSWPAKKRMEKAARRSQARRYPGDWVFEMVDGDGETFDHGMDVLECGALKFLHAQGADELGPYLCDGDYVTAEIMGYGLRRTKTLAWGCDRCDFRISRDGETSAPWPPRFVERTCGEPTMAD